MKGNNEQDIIAGRNSVREAILSGRRVNKLLLAKGMKGNAAQEFIKLAKERGLLWQTVGRETLNEFAAGLNHQGVAAFVSPVPYYTLEDIMADAQTKQEPPFLILLDDLTDPHNLGAIIRTAEAAGAHGILIPKRRSVPLNATVAKTSSGAVEYVKVARIGNISQTLQEVKKNGLWVVGADMGGNQNFWEADLAVPLVLVIGSEGKGLSPLTLKNCDIVLRLPMRGQINSLNAGAAASIFIYEIMRQRLCQNLLH